MQVNLHLTFSIIIIQCVIDSLWNKYDYVHFARKWSFYCKCFYEQYADICFSYGFWNGNINAVVAKYWWQFPNCRFPSRSALSNWEKLGHSTQVLGNVPYKKLIVGVAALTEDCTLSCKSYTLYRERRSCVEKQLKLLQNWKDNQIKLFYSIRIFFFLHFLSFQQ